MMTQQRRTLYRGGIAALALIAGTASVFSTGCAYKQRAERLEETNRVLTESEVRLTQELEAARKSQKILQEKLGDTREQFDEQQRVIAQLQADKRRFASQIDEIDEQLRTLPFSTIDPGTDKALREFAAQNKGLVQYNSDTGMLRFTSDLTFGSGSSQLKDTARSSLESLAKVLNASGASDYDIKVVGHTDSQPISNPNTLKRHPSNMHLSVHRAISVRDELVGFGLDPNRVFVAGWGQYKPLVPNNSKGGTPQNRRVEIFLIPSDDSQASFASPESTKSSTSAPSQMDDFTK